MFVLKNAWAAVVRRRWTSALAFIVTLIVTFASMFGLAVLREDDTANGTAYDAQTAQAVIRLTDKAFAKRDGADPDWPGKNLLTWDDYVNYATAAQNAGLQFEYTVTESIPVRQSDSIQAIPVDGSDEDADKTGGELTLRSFYTLTAARANDLGGYKIVKGKHLSYSGKAPKGALISKALADKNGLKVGDTIKVGNPSDKNTTYELTIRGIYEYTDDDAPAGRGDDAKLAKDNRDNAIYVSYYTFAVTNGLDVTDATGWAIPDLNIMFSMSSPSDYEKFVKAVKKAKLADGYAISSPSLDAYRASIAPLGTLAATMRTVLTVALIAGGVILLAITLLGIRRRGGEIGMAKVVGVSSARIGWQFMLEVWMPILPAFVIGALAGGFASGPLGAALAGGHATGVLAATVWQVIWYGVGVMVVLAVIAALRVAFLPTSRLLRAPRSTAGVDAGTAGGDAEAEAAADAGDAGTDPGAADGDDAVAAVADDATADETAADENHEGGQTA